jgi:hypothetical protein
MKKLGLWIALLATLVLAGCAHRGHHGGGMDGQRPNHAMVRLTAIDPANAAAGFLPEVSREPFTVARGSGAANEPLAASWNLGRQAPGATLTIRITRYLPLGKERTAANYLEAFRALPNAPFNCPLVKRDERVPGCACASADGSSSATCTFGSSQPAVFKYDICVKRPGDAGPTCLDPTGMIN